jgi:hypothetical protein
MQQKSSPARLIQVSVYLWLAAAVFKTFSVYSAEFPVSVSQNRRYFIDRNGEPFFIHSDTPWSLIVALDTAEVEQYFRDRREKGFNTVTVNLVEHWFNREILAYPAASMNRAGEYPFRKYFDNGLADFTTPNENYFRHVDRVLEIALQSGFLVMIAPVYMGYAGEGLQEGWYNEVLANGAERCREYGRFLGERYADYPNIIWIMDGDRNPDSLSRPLEVEIIHGIKEFDKVHLFSAHCHPTNSSRDQWEGEAWLDFNCVYTYSFSPFNSFVHEQCLRSYVASPAMPTILFETCYENEHGAPAGQIRAQMYWGWLCSVAGVQFGNLPVWRFGEGWKCALGWQGSCDAAIMKSLVESRNWYKLVPDYKHVTVFEGYGSGEAYVAAALAENGETMIAYIPRGTAIWVDLSQISGNKFVAWWFNPRNGLSQAAGEFTERGKKLFTPPDRNDWVLVVDDATCQLGIPGK